MENLILGLSTVLAAWVANAGGIVVITNRLKDWMNLSGFGARMLSLAVTAVLGTILALASGELSIAQLQNLPEYIGFLYGLLFAGTGLFASQWLYQATSE
jgi:hypothetical protein